MKKTLILAVLSFSLLTFMNLSYAYDEDGWLTEHEWKIIDDLWDRLDALPENASEAAQQQVFSDVAYRYNMSIDDLYDLDEAAFWEEMYMWYY